MAFTSQQIVDYLLANPGMTDAQIVAAMETFQISPAQMAAAVNLDEGAVVSRVAATVPPGSSVTLGDTRVAPQYQTTGSGMDQQVGGLENVYVEKVPTGDVNYKSPVGTPIQVYSPTGELVNTIKTQKEQSFFGGLGQALTDPVVLAALGGAAYGGLLGGAGTAATLGSTGLTAAELAQLDLALGGAGGTAGATSLANALSTGANVGLLSGGADVTTNTAREFAAANAATSTLPVATIPTATTAATTLGSGASTTLGGAGSSLSGLTGGSSLSGLTAGSSLSGLTAGSSLSGLTAGAGALTGANTLLGGAGLGTTLAGLGAGASLLGTAATGLGANNLANLLSGGLGTAGSLLQMQQSKEAALAAQQMIESETAAAKQSAAFRPIGMTTRFGTSKFGFDPTTGQMTSAGYTLSPEAKNAQDRFITLAGAGLTQAEGAQEKFKPLQTGAESLFTLGNKYLAQTPEDVAKDYLKSQMDLLKPGRDLELANIETRLRNQGRLGLSVAQGGNLGAASPELQALYNARARQEAELAANAQQLGQRDVLFGSSLLGQGAQTMGNYYGGQQQAYAPYTTALGQVQNLETLAQQPFTMGTSLAQQAAQAGSNVGQLGLGGAKLSTALATSANATANPYAQALMAAGNPNAMFGQSLGNVFGGLFS